MENMYERNDQQSDANTAGFLTPATVFVPSVVPKGCGLSWLVRCYTELPVNAFSAVERTRRKETTWPARAAYVRLKDVGKKEAELRKS